MEHKALNPPLNQSFLKRLNDNNKKDESKLTLDGDALKNVISKEIKFKDLNDRLQSSRQEKVLVKEVFLESELDFVNSIKQLKGIYKEELKQAIEKVNDLFQNELLKLQQLYRSEVIGDKLLELVKTVADAGWYLLMKDKSVNLCKFYSPAYEVTDGVSEHSDMIKVFEDTVCYLKAIYVNILHTKITYGTINLSTEDGQHPNCEKANFGAACAGSLQDRPIPLDNPNELLQLLNEISNTYQRIFLDSSYFTPSGTATTRKDNTWKTAM
jgi:hypothetical protein